MICCYFDESESGPVFLIAGWVSDYETWSQFTTDWNSVLSADPPVQYFKHHEAKTNPPSGQFEGWSAEQVDAKISRLVDVICRHEMYGAATGLRPEIHDAMFSSSIIPKKQLRSIVKMSHYYQACVFSVHAVVLQVQIDCGQIDKRVDCVFDEMTGLLSECIDKYREYKEKLPPEKKAIAGDISAADDKKVAALQAADLLAGQLTTNLRLGRPEEPLRRMISARRICNSTAYLPGLEQIPDLISALNVVWAAKNIARAASKNRD
jgi:hypothetical protein